MLSKRHWQDADPTAAEDLLSVVRSAFVRGGKAPDITPLPGAGTLGVCYLLHTSEGDRFVKTHLPGRTYQAALLKEAVLLQRLYDDEVLREVVSVEDMHGTQTLLVMERLNELDKAPGAEVVSGLIDSFAAAFRGFSKEENKLLKPAMDDFSDILDAAEEALAELASGGHLPAEVAAHCAQKLAELATAANGTLPVLCHGDLSNKNILQKNGRLYVLDWEDAFWGIAGYDFAYWLTFMDQRRYYDKKAFAALPARTAHTIAIMVAVVLVKCHLSLQNGSWRQNRISFAQRLKEILQLDEAG